MDPSVATGVSKLYRCLHDPNGSDPNGGAAECARSSSCCRLVLRRGVVVDFVGGRAFVRRPRFASSASCSSRPSASSRASALRWWSKSEAVQHAGVGAHRDAWFAAFDRSQCWPRHACAFRQEGRGDPSTQPREPQIFAEVFDRTGAVIGIVTAGIVDAQAINFAIRTDTAVQGLGALCQLSECMLVETERGAAVQLDGHFVGKGRVWRCCRRRVITS